MTDIALNYNDSSTKFLMFLKTIVDEFSISLSWISCLKTHQALIVKPSDQSALIILANQCFSSILNSTPIRWIIL